MKAILRVIGYCISCVALVFIFAGVLAILAYDEFRDKSNYKPEGTEAA